MIAEAQNKARYIMIGGFLGAGKTTVVAKLGQYLQDRGLRVGLISNDQSTGLVDTAMLRSQGFEVEEITGGCFCCRFHSLLEAANKLTDSVRPDVFIAEPVGSCTDLVATVSYPLRRIYGNQFTTAPLSVVVDPIRCARIHGLSEGRSFSEKVVYVYRKQLEEAAIIVINKCDLLSSSAQEELKQTLQSSYPLAKILCCSARNDEGLDDWFSSLMTTEAADTATMNIDYETYAQGEALLGWLNATVQLSCETPLDANKFLVHFTNQLRKKLEDASCEIAHLKMTLDGGDVAGNIAVVSVVGHEDQPDLRETLFDAIESGELIINLRAEADPELLRSFTMDTLEQCVRDQQGLSMKVDHLEHFRPGKPEPTHRITVES